MELKEYQLGVLAKLDEYLRVLSEERLAAEEFVDFQISKGRQAVLDDYSRKAWDRLNQERKLPLLKVKDAEHPAQYLSRYDGLTRSVPNICFKVPTGGGKTLLAAAAIERIQTDYFHRQTGLVLWVVPSDAIYRQTWKQLANREHPYRQMLERASGGRVKLLEKDDAFNRRDVESMLCVLLLMLPSAARQSKETLRMFRDSGRFTSFFPPEDDEPANAELAKAIPNLRLNDLGDAGYQDGIIPGSVSIKQSLGNTLCLIRPIIILDEGHKAYTDNARETLLGFNPRFILELSATPNTNGLHQSNVLVNVPGADLKDEQMIKLPINVINEDKGGWKHTLTLAHSKLEELARESEGLRATTGRYIRPILLVRVERTGKGQEDKDAVHAEHARQYLIGTLNVREEEIRLKTSEKDELEDEDLLSETSRVRYIITKDALREGWDCPFAYVLAILSRTTAQTALTQMIGRVLRQPHATATDNPALDECYVFTFDQDVTEAVNGVRRGLEDEGMADLASQVRGVDASSGTTRITRRITIARRAAFADLPPIRLPRILHMEEGGDSWRLLDYDRDIIGNLDWESFHDSHPDADTSEYATNKLSGARINLVRKARGAAETTYDLIPQDVAVLPEEGIDRPFLTRQLMEVIPNPWQAMRVLEESLDTLIENGHDEEFLYANRFEIIQSIKRKVGIQVSTASELLYRERLNLGKITFRSVLSSEYASLHWSLPGTLDIEISDDDRALHRKSGAPIEKSLFEAIYTRDINGLERDVALYLDESPAVVWWHRLPVGRSSYGLQGWLRHKVYPDFLVCLRDGTTGKYRFALLETKGGQLKGNDDTDYKKKLFDLLTSAHETGVSEDQLPLEAKAPSMRLRMVHEENWQETLKAEGI